jgi:replicative superfamily II helicase
VVDFTKRLSGQKASKPVDPVKLYDTLDRLHDKGPLRPAQDAVLQEWFNTRLGSRDVLVKLHTGQGKTLVGLLMLQSQINQGKGPAVYLCPDNFLIDQTCEQARQFGIPTCKPDPELPESFLNGDTILVTSVQKLFNGLTKFGLYKRSIKVGTMLMDDAHACSDTIREQCRIRVPDSDPLYEALLTLFSDDLEQQGLGTFADIVNDKRDAFLPVPYWAWSQRVNEVARLLSQASDRKYVKFPWPLLRDLLTHCQCVISGAAVEIEPYIPPLEAFGSFSDAEHRIFMSATVTDDAFLIKGLKLKPETIINPLTYSKEKWSGEKMVLLPSLIHDSLNRELIVKTYGTPNGRRAYGVVGLAPGFAWTKDWKQYGAVVPETEFVSTAIQNLKNKHYGNAVVLANRYNGIDLPDDTCRTLIFDSKPFSESLIDLYEESCRHDSVATLMKTVRTVEQGLGRSVRGEKDYSVIIISGADITRLVRDRESRKFLSSQMSTQIQIGLEIAELARDEIEHGTPPEDALNQLIRQCLGRDDGWKAFYADRMTDVRPKGPNEAVLNAYSTELRAEVANASGDYATAIKILQALIDDGSVDPADKGWYLQIMARYAYSSDRIEAQRLQVAAHKTNRLLLKPDQGVTVTKLSIISQGRVERIISWLRSFESYAHMDLALTDILGRLVFGIKADRFEQALDELSRALGFAGERPDKEWKEGPDNLWALDDNQYILWECKNEVEVTRAEINKREAEQMNRSSAWFMKHYQNMKVKRLIVHPSHKEASAASFLHEVEAVRVSELKKLIKNIRDFFKSFEGSDFEDLSPARIQQLIDAHGLSIPALLRDYGKKIKSLTDNT